MKTPEILRARRRLCLKIAEDIQTHFKFGLMSVYDVDKAAKIIDMALPLTYAEAEAEFDAAKSDYKDWIPDQSKPSIMAELRDALGLKDEKVSLRETFKAAVERVKALDAEKELAKGLGETCGRLFAALRNVERASSLSEAKRLAKEARVKEGVLS